METTQKSPAVARRETLSLKLEEILAAHSPGASEALDEFVAPVREPGEPSPDWAAPLDFYRRKLAWSRGRMLDAERAFRTVLATDARLCQTRDDLIARLVADLLKIRSTCTAWFGKAGLESLGLGGQIAKNTASAEVLRKAEEVTNCLRPPDAEILASEGPDAAAWLTSRADGLERETVMLGWTLEAIERKRRQAEGQLACRKQRVEAFDGDYLAIGRVVKATLRLAGHTEAARRIYTSARCLNSASA